MVHVETAPCMNGFLRCGAPNHHSSSQERLGCACAHCDTIPANKHLFKGYTTPVCTSTPNPRLSQHTLKRCAPNISRPRDVMQKIKRKLKKCYDFVLIIHHGVHKLQRPRPHETEALLHTTDPLHRHNSQEFTTQYLHFKPIPTGAISLPVQIQSAHSALLKLPEQHAAHQTVEPRCTPLP